MKKQRISTPFKLIDGKKVFTIKVNSKNDILELGRYRVNRGVLLKLPKDSYFVENIKG